MSLLMLRKTHAEQTTFEKSFFLDMESIKYSIYFSEFVFFLIV